MSVLEKIKEDVLKCFRETAAEYHRIKQEYTNTALDADDWWLKLDMLNEASRKLNRAASEKKRIILVEMGNIPMN